MLKLLIFIIVFCVVIIGIGHLKFKMPLILDPAGRRKTGTIFSEEWMKWLEEHKLTTIYEYVIPRKVRQQRYVDNHNVDFYAVIRDQYYDTRVANLVLTRRTTVAGDEPCVIYYYRTNEMEFFSITVRMGKKDDFSQIPVREMKRLLMYEPELYRKFIPRASDNLDLQRLDDAIKKRTAEKEEAETEDGESTKQSSEKTEGAAAVFKNLFGKKKNGKTTGDVQPEKDKSVQENDQPSEEKEDRKQSAPAKTKKTPPKKRDKNPDEAKTEESRIESEANEVPSDSGNGINKNLPQNDSSDTARDTVDTSDIQTKADTDHQEHPIEKTATQNETKENVAKEQKPVKDDQNENAAPKDNTTDSGHLSEKKDDNIYEDEKSNDRQSNEPAKDNSVESSVKEEAETEKPRQAEKPRKAEKNAKPAPPVEDEDEFDDLEGDLAILSEAMKDDHELNKLDKKIREEIYSKTNGKGSGQSAKKTDKVPEGSGTKPAGNDTSDTKKAEKEESPSTSADTKAGTGSEENNASAQRQRKKLIIKLAGPEQPEREIDFHNMAEAEKEQELEYEEEPEYDDIT